MVMGVCSHQQALQQKLYGLVRVFTLAELAAHGGSVAPSLPLESPRADWPSHLIYTSGSTGLPKGAAEARVGALGFVSQFAATVQHSWECDAACTRPALMFPQRHLGEAPAHTTPGAVPNHGLWHAVPGTARCHETARHPNVRPHAQLSIYASN